jgi:DNA-binding transcriptional MerR regulator
MDEATHLTTSSVARVLGVAECTVRLMERRGELPCTRTASGVRLFDRAVIERIAAERLARRVPTPDEAAAP